MSSLKVVLHGMPSIRLRMSVIALVPHEPIGPYVAAALVGSLHHAVRAVWSALLLVNAVPVADTSPTSMLAITTNRTVRTPGGAWAEEAAARATMRLQRPPDQFLEEGAAKERGREMAHWNTKPASATSNEPTPTTPRVDHCAPRPPCASAAV